MISKQREMFNELADERIKEITELNKKVNYDDLIYRYKGNTCDEKCNTYDNAFSLLDKTRDVKISLSNAKNDQEKFRLDLNEIKKRKQKTSIKRAKKRNIQY